MLNQQACNRIKIHKIIQDVLAKSQIRLFLSIHIRHISVLSKNLSNPVLLDNESVPLDNESVHNNVW